MVIDGLASLVISSRTQSLEHLTDLLEIEPTEYWELGDPRATRRPGTAAETRRRTNSVWAIHVHDAESDHLEDETGVASLRRLADVLKGKGPILESLRPQLEPGILWTGDSDSDQGGFYVPSELLRDLADLRCGLMMTVSYEAQKKQREHKRSKGQGAAKSRPIGF